MDPVIVGSIVSVVGTLTVSLTGIFTSTRLITYRLQQLEETVNKHNVLLEKTLALELKQKDMCDRLEKIEDFVLKSQTCVNK